MKLKLTLLLTLAVSLSVFSQIPTYYNDVNLELTGTALRDELSTKVINTHTTTLSYGWTAIQETDLDPTNNTNVFLIYGSNDADGNYITDKTRSVNDNGGTAGTQWNREHTYPKSLGNPNLGTSGPGADVHHLRASDITMNSNRASLLFITGSGTAGTSGSGWYPGDEWKGDVARMMMYMYLRYGSRCYPTNVAIGTTNSVDSNMIDLLLDWNAEDPVSDYEIQRNTSLETLQGNRNPFIDNPAFATTIWGGTQAEDKFGSAATSCSDLFFSEYIEGSSNNKYLEIYNPTNASIDLSNYDIVSYTNGSSSISNTLTLSGTIAAYSTFTIENSSEAQSFTADLSTTNAVMTYNGDDAIALRKSSIAIDIIGQIGTDPGSQWSGTTCTLGTADGVLRRNSTVSKGDSDGTDTFDPDTEWTCSAIGDTSDLGSYTNDCASSNPEIDIQGNSTSITSGDSSPNASDDTDFGSVSTSSGTVIKTFTILNTGTAALTLSSVPVVSGTNSADFSLSASPSLSISSSSSTTFSITFDPSADGTRTATITVNSDDSDEATYTFDIQGTGTASSGCTDLFFSEYIEGSGNNKYLEIYNPTNASIDLSNYDIVSYTNGSSSISNTLSLSGTIAAFGTFTIENSSEALGFTADLSTTNAVMTYNGDDAIALRKSSVAIDVIGQIGTDPGSQWSGTECTLGTKDGVLRRNSSITEGDSDGTDAFDPDTEWTCSAIGDTSGLGSYTNDCASASPEIDIQGNSITIPDEETSTSVSNDTDFGSINTVSGSITKRFTILNTGGGTLTLSGDPLVVISGTNESDFTLSSTPNSTISSAGSTTFDITFNPSDDGDRTATLTINSDDADESVYNFDIKGTGTSSVQSCASISGATIFQQDFESSPASPTLTYTSSNTSVSSGTGLFPTGENMFSNGTQGIQSTGSGSVTFDSVDVSSYSNIDFTFKLAAFSTSSGNGLDLADYIKVWISTDGGSTESEELIVTGSSDSNAWWSFATGANTATSVYSGSNPQNTFTPTSSGDATVNPYGTVTLTSLPNSNNLVIRIEFKRNNSAEIWVIDDAKITADTESTTTWNGTTWSDGTPNATTKVILDGNYNMATNPSINSCECEINNGNTLTIGAGDFLTIEGNLINNGSIDIDSDGSLVQVSSSATVTGSGSYSVSRSSSSLPSENVFTYWSSALTNATLDKVVANAANYYSFTAASQSWTSETSSSTMTPGVGYATQGDPDISYPSSYTAYFSGSNLNTGDIDVSISYTSDGDSDNDWNLIGNPYASAIDADAFLLANAATIGGTLYFWSNNTDASSSGNFSQNDYVSWNGVGGIAGCDGCVTPTNSIASGQGFFVQGMANGTATFTNAIRLSGENTNFYKQETSPQDKVWLNLSNEESFSQLLIGFLEDATEGIDNKYDGLRLNSDSNACFYSIIEEDPFAIQGKPSLKETEEVPLGVSLNVTGEFTISIDHLEGKLESSKVILIDKLLNIEHDLKVSNYTFTIDENGKYDNRFVLNIETPSSVLNIKEVVKATNLIILSSANQLEIKTSNSKSIKDVYVYDLLGRKVIEKTNDNSSRVIITSKNNLENHILIVKVILESGEIITKKIIR